jgi:hypothetical protein
MDSTSSHLKMHGGAPIVLEATVVRKHVFGRLLALSRHAENTLGTGAILTPTGRPLAACAPHLLTLPHACRVTAIRLCLRMMNISQCGRPLTASVSSPTWSSVATTVPTSLLYRTPLVTAFSAAKASTTNTTAAAYKGTLAGASRAQYGEPRCPRALHAWQECWCYVWCEDAGSR